MRIRSTTNGGFADVDPDYAEQLIASGLFEPVVAPKPARKAPAKRPAPRPAPKQEPKTEE
ncbi:head-tail connector protein [Mycobacterium phage CRB1]|uniref:head-tail connector protein n=1 Tax=Mycobacterium phage CRB1 TaxID=1458841 RepID=UPI0003F2168D|nr:head-tail connector protein [Mycobacterium phage CRB1]AHJ86628.1 hypothetical protein CRB1_17 [Mycobacterium phage CRB1]